jgi:hypothetical protein
MTVFRSRRHAYQAKLDHHFRGRSRRQVWEYTCDRTVMPEPTRIVVMQENCGRSAADMSSARSPGCNRTSVPRGGPGRGRGAADPACPGPVRGLLGCRPAHARSSFLADLGDAATWPPRAAVGHLAQVACGQRLLGGQGAPLNSGWSPGVGSVNRQPKNGDATAAGLRMSSPAGRRPVVIQDTRAEKPADSSLVV